MRNVMPTTKKALQSGQHSAINKETVVIFFILAYVLQLADDCWNTPRKMMSQHVVYNGGMCHTD